MEHHWIFHQLREVDNVLVGINMLLLGLVVLLPFPTATLARTVSWILGLNDRYPGFSLK